MQKTCPECGSLQSSHYFRQDGAQVVQFFCGARTERGFSEVAAILSKKCSDERTRDAVDAVSMSLQYLPGIMTPEEIQKEARKAMIAYKLKWLSWDHHNSRLVGVDLGAGPDRSAVAYLGIKMKAKDPVKKDWTETERIWALIETYHCLRKYGCCPESEKLEKRIKRKLEERERLLNVYKEKAECAGYFTVPLVNSKGEIIAMTATSERVSPQTKEKIRKLWQDEYDRKLRDAKTNAPIGSRLARFVKKVLGRPSEVSE